LSNPNGAFPVNHLQVAADFPFRVFGDPQNNRSTLQRDSAQRAGSAGVFRRDFSAATASAMAENGSDDTRNAPDFVLAGLDVRQVTPRNTPSVINAVFNVRNFWDGR